MTSKIVTAKGFDSYYYIIRLCILWSLIFTLLLMAGAKGGGESQYPLFFFFGQKLMLSVLIDRSGNKMSLYKKNEGFSS